MRRNRWNHKVLNDLVELSRNSGECKESWKSLVNSVDDNTLACLVEAVSNILRGRVPVRHKQVRVLRPHAESLRTISKTRHIAPLRDSLVQIGGGAFLAPLIPVLLSIATQLLLR